MKTKFVNEALEDVLKPKDPKFVKNLKQYFLDVLQEMINVGYPKVEVDEIQNAFHQVNRNLIIDNFKLNISARETAFKILDQILDN